ncbi:hypothetical protein EVAR_32198_1 [Eumeta japonica]|uniref:Uncharacterized protein n=1 Tax=Eumeta variegata TaxID=151549 RepID=A0A4C1VZ88_EUMVA|nr:hypothetical protein EVAR_32198_1 [Eumeta japonica]
MDKTSNAFSYDHSRGPTRQTLNLAVANLITGRAGAWKLSSSLEVGCRRPRAVTSFRVCYVTAPARGGRGRPRRGSPVRVHTAPEIWRRTSIIRRSYRGVSPHSTYVLGHHKLLSRALSAVTESRNSVTKIKPNTPHSAYHVARPSVRLTRIYMVRLYEARTNRDELLRNRANTNANPVTSRGSPITSHFRTSSPLSRGDRDWVTARHL